MSPKTLEVKIVTAATFHAAARGPQNAFAVSSPFRGRGDRKGARNIRRTLPIPADCASSEPSPAVTSGKTRRRSVAGGEKKVKWRLLSFRLVLRLKADRRSPAACAAPSPPLFPLPHSLHLFGLFSRLALSFRALSNSPSSLGSSQMLTGLLFPFLAGSTASLTPGRR